MNKHSNSAHRYRFNGHPYFDACSIQSVQLVELKKCILNLEDKLADPNDADDKKWRARWLSRYQKEFEKKLEGYISKRCEQQKASGSA